MYIFVYTNHAKQRMAQRNVNEQQVKETVMSPDEVLIGDYGEDIAIKRYGSRELRVPYEEIDGDMILVITVINRRVRS
ncbi:MAG: DUF4258 domain-containing protein [Ardenticatenaceae bacterium]